MFRLDSFTPTAGQTAFTLAAPPLHPLIVIAFVNGVEYENGVDFGVVGTTFTWNDVLFTLGTTDLLTVYFEV